MMNLQANLLELLREHLRQVFIFIRGGESFNGNVATSTLMRSALSSRTYLVIFQKYGSRTSAGCAGMSTHQIDTQCTTNVMETACDLCFEAARADGGGNMLNKVLDMKI